MIKILNHASEEEIAVIFSTVQTIKNNEERNEKSNLPKWKSYSRRNLHHRNLWEKNSLSFWQLESRKLD